MNTLTGEEKQVQWKEEIEKNIFSKHECPSYDLSDAEHMGAKPGVLQHRAKNDHKEWWESFCGSKVRNVSLTHSI